MRFILRLLFAILMFSSQAFADTRIVQLMVTGEAVKGDFVVFAKATPQARDAVRKKAKHVYCLRLNKQGNDWRSFRPCGHISMLFADTYRVAGFPELGNIEKVLSGRPLRYAEAITIAISDIEHDQLPDGSASTVRKFIQTRLEDGAGVFVGLELLRYGKL